MSRTVRMIIEDQEPLTAPMNTSVAEAASLMKRYSVGAILVVDNGSLVGIFTERDALFKVSAEGLDARLVHVSKVMTRNPVTIRPDQEFEDALRLMHAKGFRHVPVVENDRPIGIVSARDAFGSELEPFIFELVRQSRVDDIPAIPTGRD